MAKIDWMPVKDNMDGNRLIGAVGFVGDEAISLISLHDDKDLDKNGVISFKERASSMLPFVGSDGTALLRVATCAYSNPDIMIRDPRIRAMWGRQFVKTARNLIAEGVYLTYFKGPISIGSGAAAKVLARGAVKQFIVKKGAEMTAKKAFQGAMGVHF